MEFANIPPASFGEVRTYLEHERKELYLDGPNNVDWIFRNRIIHSREEAMYVDYVKIEDEWIWLKPNGRSVDSGWLTESSSFRLAKLLSQAGFDDPASLRVIANYWRGIEFTKDSHWQEDLSLIKVKRDELRELRELRELQDSWYPA